LIKLPDGNKIKGRITQLSSPVSQPFLDGGVAANSTPFLPGASAIPDQKIGVVAKTSPACSLRPLVSIGSEFGFA